MRDPFLLRMMRCGGLVRLLTLAGLVAVALAATERVARGEFVPGRLYTGSFGGDGYEHLPPVIWELDPQTGQSRKFAELPNPPYRAFHGLRFTPDGGYLRISAVLRDELLEMHGDGQFHVAYDYDDGLYGPQYMDYDGWGNMYLRNGGRREILKFPADGGPPVKFADWLQGGAPTAGLYGDVYYHEFAERIIHFDPNGQASVFYEWDRMLTWSMVMSREGDLFVMSAGGDLFRFDDADPNRLRDLGRISEARWGRLAFSPEQSVLYAVGTGPVVAIDPETGEYRTLGVIEGLSYPYLGPIDLAVYIPEPHPVLCAFLLLPACCRRRRLLSSPQRRNQSCQQCEALQA